MNVKKILAIHFLLIGSFCIGQTINKSELTVLNSTTLSVVDDFINEGEYYNDGNSYLYADYENNGEVGFVEKGAFWFVGTSEQNIIGNGKNYFYDINIDLLKTESFLNTHADISIANKANFVNGIVENKRSGGTIVFEENSTVTEVSDMSFVQGSVLRYGSQDFNAPIGDELLYRGLRVESINTSNDIVLQFENYRGNSTNIHPHHDKQDDIEVLDESEYWTLDDLNQSNSEVVITLTWREDITGKELLNNEQDIKIIRWNQQENKWVNEGGTVNIDNKSVTTALTLNKENILALGLVPEVPDEDQVVVFNYLSPSNNNGKNDFFHIKGINKYPNNSVKIFNRWGNKVFDTTGYNEQDNVFKGYSQGALTIAPNELLPAGTYFYVLKYSTEKEGSVITKTGFLYLE